MNQRRIKFSFSSLLLLAASSYAQSSDHCKATAPLVDQVQVKEMKASACLVFDDDLANSCAYRNFMARQNSTTAEQQAKAYEAKMATWNKGPIPDIQKVDANLVKKIKDYSKKACGNGPVKIQDPTTTMAYGNYAKVSISPPEFFTAAKNNFEADKSKYLKIKGSGCETDSSQPDRLKCNGAGFTQYFSKKLADSFEANDLNSYLEIANDGQMKKMDAQAQSQAKDLDEKYKNVKDTSVAAKFPEIQKSKDEAIENSKKFNSNFYQDFEPGKDIGSYVFCPEPSKVVVEDSNRLTPVQIHPTCDLSVGGNYVDNELDPKKALALDKGSENKCVEEAKKAGYEISGIKIKTASSSLNNTGAAAEKCCGKGFKCLSEARAESAKNKLPQLMKSFGLEIPATEDAVTLDSNGLNKDGTSGPCAYTGTMDRNQKFHESPIPGLKPELEKSKSVMITISFKKPNTPLPKQVSRQSRVNCMRIVFSCQ